MKNTVNIDNRTVTIPDSWNGLSLRNQLCLYGILLTNHKSYFAPEELMPAKRIMIVQELLDLKPEFMQKWEADCVQEDEENSNLIFLSELNEVLKLADFLFDIKENEAGDTLYSIKLGLTQNPYPELHWRKKASNKLKRLYGPDDELKNISLYELALSFTLFEKYLKTGDKQHMLELIATIYRPSKPITKANKQSGYKGDRRLPILDHERMVKKRMERMKNLPDPILHIITFWFAGCRNHIINKYANLFSSGDTGEKTGNDYGWGAVILNLAGGLTELKKVSKQKYSNAFTYLSYLEDQRKLAELDK